MIAVSNIQMYLAALRCTCSSWIMFSLVYGFHIQNRHIKVMVELEICMPVL
jgi:hypothetical protein